MTRLIAAILLPLIAPVAAIAQAPTPAFPNLSAAAVQSTTPSSGGTNAALSLDRLRPSFLENNGQFDQQALYRLQADGLTIWVTRRGLTFDIIQPCKAAGGGAASDAQFVPFGNHLPEGPRCRDRTVFAQDFQNIRPEVAIDASGPQPGVHNFLGVENGKSPVTGVRSYAAVLYRGAWPGIDIRLIAGESGLEQEFVVHAGADPNQIRVEYRGIQGLETTSEGALVIQTPAGEFQESSPRLFQESSGRRVPVVGRFQLEGETAYRFDVGQYDSNLDLLIDPTLLYSTYLGGSRAPSSFFLSTGALDVAVDAQGNAFVTGFTESSDFPRTPGTVNGVAATGNNTAAFVTKLNPLGNALVYSAIITGSGSSEGAGYSIALDQAGNAYVGGRGVIAGLAPPTNCINVFFVKLNATGSAFLHASYLGCREFVHTWAGVPKLAVDSSGKAAVAFTGRVAENLDINVFKIDPDLPQPASILYSKILHGQDHDILTGLALDPLGNIYLTGFTYSPDFPTTAGAFQPTIPAPKLCVVGTFGEQQCESPFVVKLDPSRPPGQSVVYSTFLGGASSARATSIAVDQTGNAYIGGWACVSGGYCSANPFPTTAGAFQQVFSGSPGFVAKLNATGSRLEWSTLLGYVSGSGRTDVYGIALDRVGNAHVTGSTQGVGFPVTPDAIQSTPGYQKFTGFLTKFNSTGSALLYSTLFGGSDHTSGTALALDSVGDPYITGGTYSPDFQVTPGAFQTILRGQSAAFVTKFPTGSPLGLAISSVLPNAGGNAGPVTLRVTGSGFHMGATAKLACANGHIVIASKPRVSSSRVFEAVFDLTGTPIGSCDLEIANPDSAAASLKTAFWVNSGGTPTVIVNYVGRTTFRAGEPIKFYIAVSNIGEIDAILPIIQLANVPTYDSKLVSVDLESIKRIRSLTVAEQFIKLASLSDNVSSDFEVIDSGGTVVSPIVWRNNGRQRFGFVPLSIAPGEVFLLGFSVILAPVPGSELVGSVLVTGSLASQPGAWHRCAGALIERAIKLAVGEAPLPGGCVTKLLQHMANQGLNIYDNIYQPWRDGSVRVGDLSAFVGTLTQNAFDVADVECGITVSQKVAALKNWFTIFNIVMAGMETLVDCYDFLNGEYAKNLEVLRVAATDPNVKVGEVGVGPARHVTGLGPLSYVVHYENKSSATASAREVVITDKIDSNAVDISTVALGPISFSQRSIKPPPNALQSTGSYFTAVDLRPVMNLGVQVRAELNSSTGVLTWRFTSIDPSTGLPPDDPLAGFLPPGAGGSVSFWASLKSGVPTGTQIRNKGSIVFDTNPPLDTAEWVNTVDSTKPASNVLSLPATSPLSFLVKWQGTDSGAGIMDYSVYVSDNGAPFVPWITQSSATQGTFSGQDGHTYGFYSIARDLVGNVEATKSAAEASTRVVVNRPPVANAGASQTVECTSPQGTPVRLNGSSSYDPDGDPLSFQWKKSSGAIVGTTAILDLKLALGTHQFTLTVSDGRGGVSSATVTVTVQDTLAPTLSFTLAPSELWPPDHRMVEVRSTIQVSDVCDASPKIMLVAITSNEADDGLGDGDTANDIQGAEFATDDRVFSLRAERSALGTGRIYAITYKATDASNNKTDGKGAVNVPLNQSSQ